MRSSNMIWGAALLLGSTSGFIAGYLLSPSEMRRDQTEAAAAAVPVPLTASAPVGEARRDLLVPDRDEQGTQKSQAGISPPTPEGLSADDWKWMLQALQGEKYRRENAIVCETDSGLDVFKRLTEHGADANQVFCDFESFSHPLEKQSGSPTVIQVTPQNIDEILGDVRSKKLDGTVFELAAGDYAPKQSFHLTQAAFVIIRGSGMESTRIRCESDFVYAHGVEDLMIQDLAIDTGDNDMLDSREPGSVLLRRVSIRGFDIAAGHSAAIGVSAGTYLGCESCEFFGGYGDDPLSGSAVSLRGRSYVYLKGCLFRELEHFVIATNESARGSLVMIDGCVAEHNSSTGRYADGIEVRLRNCRFLGVVQTNLAEGKTVDLGGNSVTKVDESDLPVLLDAARGLDQQRDIRIVGLDIAASRSRRAGDASYVRVREALYESGELAERTAIYFTAPGEGAQLRRTERRTMPSDAGRQLMASNLGVTPVIEAAQIKAQCLARSLRIVSDPNGHLLYQAYMDGGEAVVVDPFTGAVR
ncbi:MAG: hypothetical protein AB1486_09815 [Planctomycetota bacterium]